MGIVVEIGTSNTKGGKIKNVDKVDVLKGKGVVSDRKFRENNDKNCQITIIEIENIKYFNNKNKTNIAPAEFRRNIISKDIRLNELLGREFKIGMVKVKAHDLCRPCKYLQDKLKQNNFVKEFLQKGGLRCEILTNGQISVNDIIEI